MSDERMSEERFESWVATFAGKHMVAASEFLAALRAERTYATEQTRLRVAAEERERMLVQVAREAIGCLADYEPYSPLVAQLRERFAAALAQPTESEGCES